MARRMWPLAGFAALVLAGAADAQQLRAPAAPAARSALRIGVRVAPPLAAADLPLRRGFGGSMVDLVPTENDLFHLSGGRLFGPRRRAAPDERQQLLGDGEQRVPRRHGTGMVVGYGRAAEQGLSFGVDAGAVLGPALPAAGRRDPRLPRAMRDGFGGRAPNGVARVTMQYRF